MALPAEVLRAVNAAANRAADKAARSAVKETLTALGIDISTPSAVVDFQRDQAYTRKARTYSEARSTKFALAFIGVGFTIMGGVIVAAVKKFMGW